MKKIIMTLAEAVKKYGNKAIKKNLKDNNGNLKANQFKQLLKVLEQHFETVEYEGIGRNRIFHCGGKFKRKQKRVDKRENNGANQLVGENELKSLITSYIVQNDNDIDAMSLSGWMRELKLSNSEFSVILYKEEYSYEHIQKKFVAEIDGYVADKSDIEIIEDFAFRVTKGIKDGIASALNKLKKEGFIKLKTQRCGLSENKSIRKLKKAEAKEIEGIKAILRAKYELTTNDLNKKRDPKVKLYNEELKEELIAKFGIIIDFDAYSAQIIDVEGLKENTEVDFTCRLDETYFYVYSDMYRDAYGKHCLELAENRQKNAKCHIANVINIVKLKQKYAPLYEVMLKHFGYKLVKAEEAEKYLEEPKPKKNEEVSTFGAIRFISQITKIPSTVATPANANPKELFELGLIDAEEYEERIKAQQPIVEDVADATEVEIDKMLKNTPMIMIKEEKPKTVTTAVAVDDIADELESQWQQFEYESIDAVGAIISESELIEMGFVA